MKIVGDAANAIRLKSLDGLRGCAALIVVLHHALFASPSYVAATSNPFTPGFWESLTSLFKGTPLRLLVSGQSAVVIFFVLSGLVLSMALERADQWNYRSYILKRLSRIYIPFFIAIVSAALLWLVLQPEPSLQVSEWFNADWSHHKLTFQMLASHLAMTGVDTWLDNPMWSLVHELRIAIIFPLVAWAVHSRPLLSLGGLAVAWASSQITVPAVESTILQSVFASAGITFYFGIGSAIYFNLNSIQQLVARMSAPFRLSALVAALLLLMAPQTLAFMPLLAVGSALIVAMVAADRTLIGVFQHRVFLWLGRISYSLYLTHLIVFNVVAATLLERIGFGSAFSISVALSLVVATIFHKTVEQPAMHVGRLVAGSRVRSKAPANVSR